VTRDWLYSMSISIIMIIYIAFNNTDALKLFNKIVKPRRRAVSDLQSLAVSSLSRYSQNYSPIFIIFPKKVPLHLTKRCSLTDRDER